jgi:hypothetical protein
MTDLTTITDFRIYSSVLRSKVSTGFEPASSMINVRIHRRALKAKIKVCR